MADLQFLSDALSGSETGAAPKPTPSAHVPDVDFISSVLSSGEPSKRFQLEQQLFKTREEGKGIEAARGALDVVEQQVGYASDPLGTLFKGLHQAGSLAAGGVADIGKEALTYQPSNWENLRAAAAGVEGPLPIEKELAQKPGVLPALASGALGAVRTAPTLAAGAALTTATGGAAAPFVIYPALFGGQTLYETGDVGQAAKSAAIGAFYPVVGKLVGPASAAIVNRLGLAGRPLAQKAVETTVDQVLMQAATHLISLPEYATMTPDERERAFFENTGSILVFTLPRVLGYAAGAPSEYEAAIREESSRLRDLFHSQQEEEARTAQRGETAQLIRGVRRASSPARAAAARIAEQEVVPGSAVNPPVELLPIEATLPPTVPDISALTANPPVGKLVPSLPTEHRVTPPEDLRPLLDKLGVNYGGEIDYSQYGHGILRRGELIDSGGGVSWKSTATPQQIADTVNSMRQRFVDAEKKKEVPNATDQITKQSGVQQQRLGANARLQEEGQNRQFTPEEQTGGNAPGAGNRVQPEGGIKTEAAPPEAVAPLTLTGETRVFKKSEWQGMPVVREPEGKTGKIKSDADGLLWEWTSGGKRVQARQVIIPEARPAQEPSQEGVVPPVVPVPPVTPERLTIKANRVTDLPEFQLARKNKPADTVQAWLSYNPRGGQADFIQVRGASSLSSYRIPLSLLPQNSWEKTKLGITVDKQAILDFLNDPAKRRQAMSTTGNVKRFHPDDVAELLSTAKPPGRPATGAGGPLGEVSLPPDVLDRVAPARGSAVEGELQLTGISRRAFDDLWKRNPVLAEAILRSSPMELGDAFWTQVRDEIAKMPEYAADPRAPDALTTSIRNVKDSGSSDLMWLMSRGGTVAPVPMDLVTAQGAVQRLLGGSVPPNVRFVTDPRAPLGFVSFRPGEMPMIDLNLAKHTTPEELQDTLLEELIHPLQRDPALRQVFKQIEALVTEADLARQKADRYQLHELLPEATNEIVRTLYGQHAEANVFQRAVNQVTLAIKRFFGLNLTDEQVALHLVNQALKNRRAAGGGQASALESPEKVEEYSAPLTHNPEQFRLMAQVLNKGLVPPPVLSQFEALSPGARGELAKVFPGRIGTYRNEAGVVAEGPTFRQVMTDPARTPEQRNDYARHGLAEYVLYQKDKQDVHDRLASTTRDLDTAVTKSITDTPPTNEAELLATNLMGGILDKIKAEREKTAEWAQTNERIREGIDHIDQLTELLQQPVALGRAMRGIANQVGRDALMAARPGEDALQLISEGTEFPGGVFATPAEWIRALANHLDHLTRSDGTKAILASRDVIEAALYGLRQVADARESLLEVQMTSDGTLKRFNADYLADLQSKTPTGFNGVLKKYAKAQVESDALSSAFKRLNRRIDTLTERKANLEEATAFLNQHDLNPEFRDFGRAVIQYTGARDMQYTRNGPVVEYVHPLTGDPVRIEHTFDKGETVENIQKLQHLAEAGLEYAAQPNANPQKAAFWTDFANQIMDYQLVASPDYGRLEDPLLNPLAIMTKSKYGLIAETALSRIPGALSLETTRAIEAFASAMKTKNEFQKDNEASVLSANLAAQKTHQGLSLDRWQKEVASPIIDSRQHFGQTVYRSGDLITGFGHVITPEDIKAVNSQYQYEQTLRRLHERARVPAVTNNPAKIKEGNIQRMALSRGSGTVTRIIPRSTRDLPAQWRKAVEAEPVEGKTPPVDEFLNSGDNFIRVMLGHVMEEERDYFQLGKGAFARDYRALRLERQALEKSGHMPGSLDELSEWIANHHNDNLPEGRPPVTPGEVRKTLIEEVSRYMTKIGEDTLEKANAAKMDIVSYENGFTQPRGGKIAPGTLYQYGVPDRAAMISKGNDAVEFYAIRYRDSLKNLHEALLKDRERLGKAMEDIYGQQGIGARRKLDKGIEAGNDPRLQHFQMTAAEVDRNITRVGGMLNNMRDILHNREAFFGDDIANRIYSPWIGASVGSVLMRPLTWMTNGASGSVMWMMKMAEIRRGGWLTAPTTVLKNHIVHFMNTILLKFVPKNAKERAYKRFLVDNPELMTGTADFVTSLLYEASRREALRQMGVIDSFSVRDYVGWDPERSVMQNLKGSVDTMRNVAAKPDTSALKSIFSYMGIIPRTWQIATRKIGMRWADNWINGQSTQFAEGIAEQLRVQAIKSFDARLKNDPVFKHLYEDYGDNFQRFALAVTGRGTGELLTPSEITGKFDPLTREKAAIQLRRTFIRNGDSADLLMLKYWWNKRSENGDRNAQFLTEGQRNGLMVSLAEDVNLGTLASRSTWFAGNRNRQLLGVLSQYWLWATDRLADLVAKPKGQRTLGVRYAPAIIGFLLSSAFAALISRTAGQKANDTLFNTVSQKPSFWDAQDDAQRAKILLANTASYWGAMGSLVSLFMDTPGKLGYRNPIFLANVLTDLLNVGVSGYQSGDYATPTMNFLAKYNPVAQALINQLPSRTGLMEVRNAANALRAATPDTLEAKRRQPSSGSDFRSTPMTPLYNAILNAAVQKDWGTVDELWNKAVEQGKELGIPNPESAILSAIRTRAPESAVFQRVLTPEERDMVYSRMTPEARAQLESTNAVFAELATRYGRTGATGGGGVFGGGIAKMEKPLLADIAPVRGVGGLSLGASGGVRRGFRTRSLLRRGRGGSLRGGRIRSRRLRGLTLRRSTLGGR